MKQGYLQQPINLFVTAFLTLRLLVIGSVNALGDESSWRDFILPCFDLAAGEDIPNALDRYQKVLASSNVQFKVQWLAPQHRKNGAATHAENAPLGPLIENVCAVNGLFSIQMKDTLLIFDTRHWEESSVFVCKGTVRTEKTTLMPRHLRVHVQVGASWHEASAVIEAGGKFISVLSIVETRRGILVDSREIITVAVQSQLDDITGIRIEADGFVPFIHRYLSPPKSSLQEYDVFLVKSAERGGK